MPAFEVWDTVKVPFPYTNRPVLQKRPALVVARPDSGNGPQLLWVLMLTSAAHRRWQGDVEVVDLGLAGLPVATLVRTAKAATIEADVAEPLGVLGVQERAVVRSQLTAHLATALAQP